MSDRPIRILQVVGKQMNRGGLETWILHVLKNIDRDRFQMDFLVESPKPGDLDEDIRREGARIIVASDHHDPVKYARSFGHVLREEGPYDVVHSHHHHVGGYALMLAHRAGVPVRISHSHGDFSTFDAARSKLWQVYAAGMKALIRRYATVGLGVSEGAASDMFGAGWRADPRWRLLYCGIDLKPFADAADRKEVREEFGIPEDAFVFGHVGRFFDYKNQSLLIDMASSMAEVHPNTYLMMIGDGPTYQEMKRKARSSGAEDRVVFTGLRNDIPRLMLGALDVFVLPSWFEGLPLVGLEAQAAGLPMLLSEVVTRELDVIPEKVQRLPLSASPRTWAETASGMFELPRDTERSRRLVQDGPFNIDFSVKRLEEIYASR